MSQMPKEAKSDKPKGQSTEQTLAMLLRGQRELDRQAAAIATQLNDTQTTAGQALARAERAKADVEEMAVALGDLEIQMQTLSLFFSQLTAEPQNSATVAPNPSITPQPPGGPS